MTYTATLLVVIIVVIVIVFIIFAAYWSVMAHRRKISAGKEDLVGRLAVVETALDPRGIVLIEGERWTAISENGRAEPEEEVIVTRVEGLRLTVTRKV